VPNGRSTSSSWSLARLDPSAVRVRAALPGTSESVGLAAEFVERADARGLDVDCAERSSAPPFVVR
jgi:hypothetical protein